MITQTALTEAVLSISNNSVLLADKARALRLQGDHDARRREIECMALRVIYKSLNYYDVASELLSEEEINQMLDTSYKIIQKI